MITAIVYTSNTGFTKKYAELLGEEINVPVYEFKEAKQELKKDNEIIYVGWIMAGGIKNYKKAISLYNVKAVCAVGMSVPDDKQYNDLIKKYNIKEKLFYLQGGYDKNKLHGIYKLMMSSIEKVIKSNIEKKENKSKNDLETLEMMNGKYCVKLENLTEIISWIKS